MDFVQILSGECIHQEMKIMKILSLYHVWFRNYDHLKYGPFSLDKCAKTHCGSTLPGILYVKTKFNHIFAYLVELGATKLGCNPKNGILG